MPDQIKVLYRTNYFQREWTWIRRFFGMIFIAVTAWLIPLEGEFLFLRFLVAGLTIIYLLVKPKDDIALTDKSFLRIRRSVYPKFTRIEKYEISEIVSIRCAGVHSDAWELVDLFNGGSNSGGHSNSVEISFKNKTSTSFELRVDRKKLDKVIKLIYQLKQKPNIV